MVDLGQYMTNDNLVFACAAVVFMAFLLFYLVRHFRTPPLPAPLELLIVGTTPRPVRDLMEEFNSRLIAYKEKSQQVQRRQKELEELNLEDLVPTEVLDGANQDERANLISVFPPASLGNGSNQDIVDAIRKAGSHSLVTVLRHLGSGEKHVAYLDVARDVAHKVGAKVTKKMAIHEYETLAIVSVFDTILKNASPEEREALLKGVQGQHGKTYMGPTVAAGTLALANLSGLGLYLASTANTIALASALGIAIPSYAGVISILSVATGPVGWSALAVIFAYKLGGPDFKITVPAVMMIASIRARQIAERDAEIQRMKDMLSDELATERSSLETFRARIHVLTAELSARK
jgi:uncharacterized protein YaaW (UPF0174 family)